jgi:hypothetical protein
VLYWSYAQRVSEPVEIQLPDELRELLAVGLVEWGGPARATDALAWVMGFRDVRALHEEGGRIADALRASERLSAADWRRALVATEFVFVSDVYGSGSDWASTTGFTDEETIRRLRAAQSALIAVVGRDQT